MRDVASSIPDRGTIVGWVLVQPGNWFSPLNMRFFQNYEFIWNIGKQCMHIIMTHVQLVLEKTTDNDLGQKSFMRAAMPHSGWATHDHYQVGHTRPLLPRVTHDHSHRATHDHDHQGHTRPLPPGPHTTTITRVTHDHCHQGHTRPLSPGSHTTTATRATHDHCHQGHTRPLPPGTHA